MNVTRKTWRVWAASLGAIALSALTSGSSYARDATDLLLKAVGTTEGVSPVIVEAVKRAAMDITPEQHELALKCWRDNVCETGRGSLTVATPTALERMSGARSPRWNLSSRR
jgi:hypothetical protein